MWNTFIDYTQAFLWGGFVIANKAIYVALWLGWIVMIADILKQMISARNPDFKLVAAYMTAIFGVAIALYVLYPHAEPLERFSSKTQVSGFIIRQGIIE